MTVQQVIDMAINGELSNIAVKDDLDVILSYLNLGMIELYKRFTLKVEESIIPLVEGVTLYELPNDFMWLVSAYEEVKEGSDEIVAEIPINVEGDVKSVNIVGWNQIQVPVTVDGAYISVIYVAAPTVYTSSDLAETIDIPVQMIEALLHYIGYRAHGAIDGNIQSENNTHYQRFEASCSRIEGRGMMTSEDLNMNTRDMKGFV